MVITNAKYIKDNLGGGGNHTVLAEVDGSEMNIPMDTDNRHYAEILKQVADGDITIAEAD
jgi:hypothetical protein